MSDVQIIMIIAAFKYERKKSWKQPTSFQFYMLGGPFLVITATTPLPVTTKGYRLKEIDQRAELT